MRYWGGPNHWVKISDMDGGMIVETSETISNEGVQNSNVKLLPAGTVLFSFKLTVGKVAIAGRDLYTNEAIVALVPRDDRVLSEYLYYVLPELDYTTYAQPATKGDTLNMHSLPRIPVPVPSIPEQEAFIESMRLLEDEANEHLRKAAEVRAVARQDVHRHIEVI